LLFLLWRRMLLQWLLTNLSSPLPN
jgi:hypothetical protein